MSGTTAPKVSGLKSEGGDALAAGATLRLFWTALSTTVADEYRAEEMLTENADGTKPASPAWISWGRVAAPPFSKGGLTNGLRQIRVVARKAGRDVTGSASDPIAVRVGPVPVPAPAPAPAPTPTPTPAPSPTPTTGTTTTSAGVTPAELRRVGASTAADEVLVVRAGEIVVATRG